MTSRAFGLTLSSLFLMVDAETGGSNGSESGVPVSNASASIV